MNENASTANNGLVVILKKIVDLFLEYNTEFIFLVMLLVFSIISDAFFTYQNIFNVLLQVSAKGLISLGMLYVILTGGIDLSVGSNVALGCVLSSFLITNMSLPLPIAILGTILMGAVLGSISGYFVAFRNMAAFVVSLAFMTIARGLSFIISEGAPILVPSPFLSKFGGEAIFGIPYPVLFLLFIFCILYFVEKFTVFGRLIKGIGSNETAVKLSGVNNKLYKFSVYVISGMLGAMAGIIITARTGVGSPMVGVGYELDAIAAVVIGGASLKGGKGTVSKTLIGVLILGIIGNIMNLKNVPAYPQQVVKGVIILFAVFFEGVRRELRESE